MYTAVKGIYENGQITITEPAPTTEKSAVIITFIGAETEPVTSGGSKVREAGWLKKWGEERGLSFSIPDDFNEPLDDLKDYM